jgi:hypothetical protein
MWQFLKRADIPLRVAAVLAVAYLGYVFLARHSSGRRWANGQGNTQAARTGQFEDTYGGTALKILQFYARDGTILEDQSTVICYGVLNARSVRIDPPVEDVQVALNKCVTVQPEHDTRYTLTAEGNDGQTLTASFTLAVKPDPRRVPKSRRFR